MSEKQGYAKDSKTEKPLVKKRKSTNSGSVEKKKTIPKKEIKIPNEKPVPEIKNSEIKKTRQRESRSKAPGLKKARIKPIIEDTLPTEFPLKVSNLRKTKKEDANKPDPPKPKLKKKEKVEPVRPSPIKQIISENSSDSTQPSTQSELLSVVSSLPKAECNHSISTSSNHSIDSSATIVSENLEISPIKSIPSTPTQTGENSPEPKEMSPASSSTPNLGKQRSRSRKKCPLTLPIRKRPPVARRSSQGTSEDGSVERPAKVAKTTSPVNRLGLVFEIGMRLEAMDFQEKWYLAKIVEVDHENNEILIHFDGWSSRYDEWISMESTKLRPTTQQTGRGPSKRSPQKFKIGERILARWTDTKMYPATISKVLTDNHYMVLFYDGYHKKVSPSSMCKATAEQLKNFAPLKALQTQPVVVKKLVEDELAAPKAFVVEEDHNHFKCNVDDCNKSFRKESLLASHVKHYHRPPKKPRNIIPKPKPTSPVQPQTKTKVETPKKTLPKVKPDSVPKIKIEEEPETKLELPENKDPPPLTELSIENLDSKDSPTVPEKLTVLEKEPLAGIIVEIPPKIGPQSMEISIPSPVQSELKETILPSLTPVRRMHRGVYPITKMETRHAKLRYFKDDSIYTSYKSVALGLPSPKEFRRQERQEERKEAKKELEEEPEKKIPIKRRTESLKTEELEEDVRSETMEETQGDGEVVHCVCEFNEENGLMIQCELCMTWQHGSCFEIEELDQVPDKYICYACINPRGMRENTGLAFDLDWFHKGELPSFNFLNEAEGSLEPPKAVLTCHNLMGSLQHIMNDLHSLRHKINIIKSGSDEHPDLKYFAKAWKKPTDNNFTEPSLSLNAEETETVLNALAQEGLTENPSKKIDGKGGPLLKGFTSFDHSYFNTKDEGMVPMLMESPQQSQKPVLRFGEEMTDSETDLKIGEEGGLKITPLQTPRMGRRTDGRHRRRGSRRPGFHPEKKEMVPVKIEKIEDPQLCRTNLSEHIFDVQTDLESKLDLMETQINLLENETKFEQMEDSEEFPRLLQSLKSVSEDMNLVQRYALLQGK